MGSSALAAAEGQRRDDDLPRLKPVDRQQGTDDVDLGIDGADLVKVDLFRGRSMHLRLRRRQRVVDGGGLLSHRLGDRLVVEGSEQFGEVTVGRGLLQGSHPGPADDDPTASFSEKFELVRRQRVAQRLDEDLLRDSQVDEGRHQHIASDTA